MNVSDNAINLMLKYEVDGPAGYNREYKYPEWPEGDSGVTIGIGYDLGYESNVKADWQGVIPDNDLNALLKVAGLKGEHAHSALPSVRKILIPWDAAYKVFTHTTLPRESKLTISTFPNSDKLPADAFGALVSLVYNRGSLIDHSDRRREMLAIRDILSKYNDAQKISNQDVLAIAAQVKSMARLWKDVSTSDNDLHDRRIEEAALIANSLNPVLHRKRRRRTLQ